MNGFSDLFSANFAAMEAENGEFCDIVGCGQLPFDGHGSSACFAQSDLFPAVFPVNKVENEKLCDNVGCGLLPFDVHGSSASSAQAGLFPATFPANKADNEELCKVLAFDGHGSSASSAQADCMLFRDYPFDLRIAEGNGEGMDKRRSSCATERVRRQRMKSCFSELASLLPSQRNSTKKSTSNIDMVSEATNYIYHLKKKVARLSKKRDEMQMMINDHQVRNYSYSSYKEGNEFPIVNIDHVDSRVLITTNTLRDHVVLSKILAAIEEQDLQLINASTFAIHDKVTHTFDCEVSHTKTLYNNIKLGQKIWEMIKEKYTPVSNVPLL